MADRQSRPIPGADQSSRKSLPVPNPVTRRKHRREAFWQITFPLIVGILLIVGLAIGLAVGGVGEAGTWSEVAMIFLTLPVLVIGLLFLALFGGLAYGIGSLMRVLPGYTVQVQDLVKKITQKVGTLANYSVEPFLKLQSLFAMIRALTRKKK